MAPLITHVSCHGSSLCLFTFDQTTSRMLALLLTSDHVVVAAGTLFAHGVFRNPQCNAPLLYRLPPVYCIRAAKFCSSWHVFFSCDIARFLYNTDRACSNGPTVACIHSIHRYVYYDNVRKCDSACFGRLCFSHKAFFVESWLKVGSSFFCVCANLRVAPKTLHQVPMVMPPETPGRR